MSTGINNGKQHTYNIWRAKLIFIIIVLSLNSVSSNAKNYEKGWVIVIDAGHGGKDPGAITANSSEKNITLAIALKTGEYIQQNIKNVTVIYTRNNDTFVELRDRASIANKYKADLFVSIHVNWAKSKNIHGTETFVMGDTKDQQNLEVAMKENEVILREDDYSTKYEGFDPRSPESYVMFSLRQKVFQEQSTDLASKIQTEFRERVDRNDRDVKQAGFWVLFMTTMPSVLVETGFITNPSEEKYLDSKKGQDDIASAIFSACKDYINEIDSKSVILTARSQPSKPGQNIDEPSGNEENDIRYMVQVTSSTVKSEIRPENFKGLSDIVEIDTGDRFRYATGNFLDYSEAMKCKKKISDLYPDAFIIAVKDSKVLTLQQALEQKKTKPSTK